MTVQQQLWLSTERESIRAEAIGWGAEDPRNLQVSGGPTGAPGDVSRSRTWSGSSYCYATPLHALADGWKLLAPPTREGGVTWEWWFVREVSR